MNIFTEKIYYTRPESYTQDAEMYFYSNNTLKPFNYAIVN